MGCKSMARREIEDPKSACHGQTGGWPNGELGECGRGKCGCGCLRGWRVGSRGKEGMVRVATLTSLEKRSNSEYISIGPEDDEKLEGGLVLEILRERPPTCPVTAGQSCLEKGAHIEPALSLAQQGARAASIRANWQLRHTLWHPSRPHAPRQASLQAWPAAGMDYGQGN